MRTRIGDLVFVGYTYNNSQLLGARVYRKLEDFLPVPDFVWIKDGLGIVVETKVHRYRTEGGEWNHQFYRINVYGELFWVDGMGIKRIQ